MTTLTAARPRTRVAAIIRAGATAALCVLPITGCHTYHATVRTGIEPGPRQIEQKWAKSYMGGLVPPETVNAGVECGEGGVATVETRRSFLNDLVAFLTIGIYTPLEIIVTCGSVGEQDHAPSQSDDVPEPGSPIGGGPGEPASQPVPEASDGRGSGHPVPATPAITSSFSRTSSSISASGT